MLAISRSALLSVLAVLAIAGLGGCAGAPPPNYYTLSSPPPSEPALAPGRTPAVVTVGPVILPDYLDRPQIVTREGSHVVRLAANDYWAAPLDDMIPRVLAQDLALRLPADRVVAFPQVAGPTFDYRIAVDVNRFDVDESDTATLMARYQIYERSQPRALVVAEESIQQPADGSGYADRAAALSGALATFSDRVAAALAAQRPTAMPLAAGPR